MTKYLIVIILFSVVVFAVYWRLRPYVKLARRALGFVRDARRISTEAPPRRAQQSAGGEKLVRCARCGTWLPASRALVLRASPHAYCSQECLERAGRDEQPAPRAARKL